MIIDEHELIIVDLVDEKQLKQAVDFMSFSNNLLDVALYESTGFFQHGQDSFDKVKTAQTDVQYNCWWKISTKLSSSSYRTTEASAMLTLAKIIG